MRALVIDDSRAMRMIVGKIIRELGFEILEAGHGLEGLERLKEHGPVDLCLVDWNMPEMNGLEFVKAVRKDAQYEAMQLVMVTTETEMQNISDALDAGANEYVMKPFTPDVIVEKLALIGIEPALAA